MALVRLSSEVARATKLVGRRRRLHGATCNGVDSLAARALTLMVGADALRVVAISRRRLHNPANGNTVEWTHAGKRILKQYHRPAYAIVLASQNGVLIVEPSGAPDNAVIYNPDGTERVRLKNPMVHAGGIAFSYPYYSDGELTANAAIPRLEFACVFDEAGQLHKVFETR